MAALKKALITILGGRGNIPKSPDELDHLAKRIFKAVQLAVDDDDDDEGREVITRNDMYTYLVMNSENGCSRKTADQLFSKIDVDGDGKLDEQEFVQVIHKCWKLLRERIDHDDAALRAIPDVFVVPGSSSHNARSGTQAFKVSVVRRASMRILWQWYQELDSDNDGYISLPEFKRYVKRKQPHVSSMSASIFASLDNNGDGLITFKEMMHKLYPAATKNDVHILMRMARPEDYEPHSRMDAQLLADVRQIFQIFDDDHSGALDDEEFAHALGLLGFDQEESSHIFREIDKDGSGEVSIQEFEAWYACGQKLHFKAVQDANRDSETGE